MSTDVIFTNYNYDGTLKQIAAAKNASNDSSSNRIGSGYDEFENVLQNKANIIKNDPDSRYNEGIALGDPESADIRIVGLGHSESGNSSLMIRLFYNEYFGEDLIDHKLMQWEQHQMNYKYDGNGDDDILRLSYFDLKGFDDILTQNDMDQRIGDTINHSFNCILLYYSIDEKISFTDDEENGFSIQNIKKYVDKYLKLIDEKKFMLILVGLKLDLEDEEEREVSYVDGQNLAKQWGNIPFIEVSAKTGQNIKKLIDLICSIYTKGFETIDGDLNEAAAFDEDKVTQKTIIKEDEEYDEYDEEHEDDDTKQDILPSSEATPNEKSKQESSLNVESNPDIEYEDEPKDSLHDESKKESASDLPPKPETKSNSESEPQSKDSKKDELKEKAERLRKEKEERQRKEKLERERQEKEERQQKLAQEKRGKAERERQEREEREKQEKLEAALNATDESEPKSKSESKPPSNDKDELKEEIPSTSDIEPNTESTTTAKQEINDETKEETDEPPKSPPIAVENNANQDETVKSEPNEEPPSEPASILKEESKEETHTKPEIEPEIKVNTERSKPQQPTKEEPLKFPSKTASKPTSKSKSKPKAKAKKKQRPKNLGLSKKTMSVAEFKSVPLRELFEHDTSLRDNYDIAKKICKFFDGQFGDKDTVCMVSESGKQPAIAYWVKGDYVRKHKNINNKHILVYRACKHRPCKQPKVSQSEFESYVKKISIKYEKESVNKMCDLMDSEFGDGCHYARSTTERPQYDIYSRFTDKYDAGFKLKSGAYIIAWRR